MDTPLVVVECPLCLTGPVCPPSPFAPLCQIPDLEEEARDADLTSAVAEAPNVRSNRVQALQELDQQILFQLPSAMVRARANTLGQTDAMAWRCSGRAIVTVDLPVCSSICVTSRLALAVQLACPVILHSAALPCHCRATASTCPW